MKTPSRVIYAFDFKNRGGSSVTYEARAHEFYEDGSHDSYRIAEFEFKSDAEALVSERNGGERP